MIGLHGINVVSVVEEVHKQDIVDVQPHKIQSLISALEKQWISEIVKNFHAHITLQIVYLDFGESGRAGQHGNFKKPILFLTL